MMHIDHSEAYRRFRDLAGQRQFAKAPPEDIHLFSKETITVASDAGKTKKFFTASASVETDGTSDPSIKAQQATPQDIAFAIHSLAIEVEHQNYAGTLTEIRDLLSTLGDSVFSLWVNSDRVAQYRGSYILCGRPGSSNYTDTATATATVRGPIERASLVKLPVPKVVPPGSQIRAELTLPGAFTTNDNIVATCVLGVWLARKGAPPQDPLARGML